MSYDLKFMAYPAYPMINRRERFAATTIPHSQKSSHGSPVGATTAEFPSECPNGNAMIFPSAHAKFTNLWWLNHHFPWSSSDNFPHWNPWKVGNETDDSAATRCRGFLASPLLGAGSMRAALDPVCYITIGKMAPFVDDLLLEKGDFP